MCEHERAWVRVLVVCIQDCVSAAASAGAYPLLNKLLTTVMTILPRLVSSTLQWEDVGASSADVVLPQGVGSATHAQGLGAAGAVRLEPAKVGYALQQLAGLLLRLLEYSELQGHLLSSPPLAPALVWSYAGLQVRI